MKITLNVTEATSIVALFLQQKTGFQAEVEITGAKGQLTDDDFGWIAGDDGSRKICAIKIYRTLNPGAGLAEAKRKVEDAMERRKRSFGY